MNSTLSLVFFALAGLLIAGLVWPRHGLLSRLAARVRRSERVQLEDAIKHVYSCHQEDRSATVDSLAGRLGVSTGVAAGLVTRLAHEGLIRAEDGEFALTEVGEASALRLVRSHRLWERYLADRTGVPASEWHVQAERMEHSLSAEDAESLASRLGHPTYDPHGDPIPTAGGDLPAPVGVPLLAAPVGENVEIVHLEDEPVEVYVELERLGLRLRQQLRVVGRSDVAVRVLVGDDEMSLGAVVAANVTVRPAARAETPDSAGATLADVQPWETASVLAISPALQGVQRRRLLDLGVVPGTEITPELVSSAGDPVAYRIRGALIALRRSQAESITVRRASLEPAG